MIKKIILFAVLFTALVNGSLILLEDKKILTTGKLSKEKKEELIDLSNSWITSQRWLLQNNYIWNNKFVED